MLKEYLTSIADSIRAKLGTSEKINAQDYADKISEVYDVGYAKGTEEGGGDDFAYEIIGRTIKEYSNENNITMGQYCFYNCSSLTTVHMPNQKQIPPYGFGYCKIKQIDLPSATSIGNNAFEYCNSLVDVKNIGVVGDLGNYTFRNCMLLENVNVSNITRVFSYAFSSCVALEKLDFPKLSAIISGYNFYNCGVLRTFILRKSDSICSLSSTSAFNSTPIKSGTGYIYVPSALIDTYKSATNWSTYATQFRVLEDYTVDGTITGELDESKI